MNEKVIKLIGIENYVIFKQYQKDLLSLKFYKNSIYHGIDHSLRVLLLMMILCKEIIVTNSEREMLYFAAVYHDIARGKNEVMDSFHGIKSWKVISSEMNISFSKNEQLYLKYIIENHCFQLHQAIKNVALYPLSNRDKAEKLIRALQTCDQLDMLRYKWFNSSDIDIEIDDYYINISMLLLSIDVTNI